ncbi:hypothetical protein [Desertibaculum subflavum]|uniref:hypothetical protein n=1 Tax=Desertibaculum subflavum TaxID=2268458 RepID=UPI000E6722A4
MEGRALVILALRLAGLFVVVTAATTLLTSFPHFLLAQRDPGPRADALVYGTAYLAPALIQLAVGLVLLRYPLQVAARALRIPISDPSSIDASQFERVAYVVLGVYFVVMGTETLLFVLAKLRLHALLAVPHPTIPLEVTSFDFASISVGAFKILVGALLVLGGGVLARWRSRLTA